MAYITNINCKFCKKTKREITHFDNLCKDCRTEIENRERRKRLRNFIYDIEKCLTIAEKIDKLEKVTYKENFQKKKKPVAY
ncbi:MAG: hypothetical protein AABY22_13540 [Nanoarchaeota archaeon]